MTSQSGRHAHTIEIVTASSWQKESGVVILEDRALALARGAHIYAEIIAFVSNSNAYHMTALPADGAPLQQLLKQALDEAHITSKQLDYINSHGSSTPANEAAETVAYKAVFGEQAYHIPISATKSMIGHTQGAASAIETIVTALVLDRQIIPPTINQEHPDPQCDLDYVPNVARPSDVQVALTHSSGFGGVNTALVLAKADWFDLESNGIAFPRKEGRLHAATSSDHRPGCSGIKRHWQKSLLACNKQWHLRHKTYSTLPLS